MSIIIPNDPEHRQLVELLDSVKVHECFYCGKSLYDDTEHGTGGIVMWHGITSVIALHQPCAEIIGVNLIQDARSLVSRTKQIAKLSHEKPIKADYLWHTK